jgi:hypothetical protein
MSLEYIVAHIDVSLTPIEWEYSVTHLYENNTHSYEISDTYPFQDANRNHVAPPPDAYTFSIFLPALGTEYQITYPGQHTYSGSSYSVENFYFDSATLFTSGESRDKLTTTYTLLLPELSNYTITLTSTPTLQVTSSTEIYTWGGEVHRIDASGLFDQDTYYASGSSSFQYVSGFDVMLGQIDPDLYPWWPGPRPIDPPPPDSFDCPYFNANGELVTFHGTFDDLNQLITNLQDKAEDETTQVQIFQEARDDLFDAQQSILLQLAFEVAQKAAEASLEALTAGLKNPGKYAMLAATLKHIVDLANEPYQFWRNTLSDPSKTVSEKMQETFVFATKIVELFEHQSGALFKQLPAIGSLIEIGNIFHDFLDNMKSNNDLYHEMETKLEAHEMRLHNLEDGISMLKECAADHTQTVAALDVSGVSSSDNFDFKLDDRTTFNPASMDHAGISLDTAIDYGTDHLPVVAGDSGGANWTYAVTDKTTDFFGTGENITVTTPIVIDGDTVTLLGVTLAQLQHHQSEFHLV